MNKDFLKLGIIGNPLMHSISPQMHSAALASVGLRGSYEKFEIKKNDIELYLKYFIQNVYAGFNVTIPYKIDIMQYLTLVDADANKIGAVNTVKINPDGTTIGYNTDIYGFVQGILVQESFSKTYNNATILGFGGAGLSVIFGLEKLNCKTVEIFVRNPDKIKDKVADIQKKINLQIYVKNISEIESLEYSDILINATPLGTKGENQDKTPIGENVLRTAKQEMLVYDLVYNPSETKLLSIAKNYGLKTTNGLNMLIYQGVKAFEIWTNLTPSIEKMKNAII